MKKLKKVLSILLTAVMVLAMSASAFAAGSGSITIEGGHKDTVYSIYRILDLESYNSDSGAYSYKVNDSWTQFIEQDSIKNTYVSVDPAGYVTWVEKADAAEFAKLALDYAKENIIKAVASETAAEDGKVSFTGLDLGYYLVDSSAGALCGLTTTKPYATIKEKNEKTPVIDKNVVDEDGNPLTENEANNASIGDTVYFEVEITAEPGAENYVMYDKMTGGLTFNEDSIVIKAGGAELTPNSDYTVKTSGLGDNCTFEISFAKEYLDTITSETIITVTYNADINANAMVVNPDTNTASLGYGDEHTTAPSQTETKIFDVNVFKYTEKEDSTGANVEEGLAGATFELKDSADAVIKVAKTETENTYRVALDGEGGALESITTAEGGKFTVYGLGNGTYTLTEKKAPAGYNKLSDPVIFTINDGTATVKVQNNTGSELPSTGGIGTTIFYAAGIILMAGAVFFVVRGKKKD